MIAILFSCHNITSTDIYLVIIGLGNMECLKLLFLSCLMTSQFGLSRQSE